MRFGVASGYLSVAEGGALDHPSFPVELDQIAVFFAVLQRTTISS